MRTGYALRPVSLYNTVHTDSFTATIMWHMKTIVIPVVVGTLGTVKKGMIENIEKVSKRANVTEIQKICMLGSARILRKVLSI